MSCRAGHYRRTPGQAPHVKLPSRSQALSSTPGSLSSLSGTRAANLKSRRPIQRGVELLLNLKFRSGAKEEQRPEVGDLLHCFSAREPFGDQSGRNSKCWVFLQAPLPPCKPMVLPLILRAGGWP